MKVDLARLHNLAEAARAKAQTAQQQRTGSWYKIENKGGGDGPASIYVYDMIGEWGVSAQDFVNDLRAVKAQAIELHVNCEGGEVFDGLAMYESLVQHPADITAYVDGIAASAASFLVQAATKIVMAPRARMMIHDAHGIVMGNARDMREMATLLDDLSDTIADIYAERSGKTRAEWREAMRAGEGGPDGTWYDAAAAVKAGLADEVRGADGKTSTDARAELIGERAQAVHDASPVKLDAAAFLAVLGEVEHPMQPIVLPSVSALLETTKTT
jgi:ATP-dependent protease ClpP protease subunit